MTDGHAVSTHSTVYLACLGQDSTLLMDLQREALDELSSHGEETDGADTNVESDSESCVVLPGPSKKVKVTTVHMHVDS